jgi:hypothetical protein
MKRLRLWIIAMSIKRVPQLVTSLVQIAAANVALSGILSQGAEALMWEHITAALIIIVTGAAQWAGAKWSGTAIEAAQSALHTRPDGLPDRETTRAATRARRSGRPT